VTTKRRRKNRRKEPAPPAENRTAEAVTVAWMLSLTATLLAELAAAAGWLLLRIMGGEPDDAGPIAALPELLLIIAALTGAVCVLLVPVTHKVRQQPPPLPISVAAVVIGSAPWLVIAALALSN
jgi:hypothetical protein